MIFMCVTESVKPSFLDRDNGIRQQTPSQFQKQVNCLFCIRVLSENQKEAFWTSYLKRTAEAAGVSSIVGTQSESLKEAECRPRRERRGSHISMLTPFLRQQSDITQFYTV